ncbi:hypothetical protein BC332_19420 [Capsicum chinense]|nr:hypothetical protein BC332_19420 [Capsicum chinense]
MYKLNTDGACLSNLGIGGIRGIIKNHQGNWVIGFSKGFHHATNNQMELLALLEGLKLVEDQKLFPLQINVDSLECLYSNIVPTVEELEQLDLPPLSFASYHLGTSSTSSSTGDPNQMSYKDNMPQVAIDYDSFEDFSTTFPQYFKIDSINVFGSICAHKSKNEKSTVVGRTTDLLMQTVDRKIRTNQLKWRRNCGVFVAVYVEYLSKELVISSSDIDAQYHRLRYASLLCKYGSVKAEKEYFSENDDPPRSRNRFTTKEKGRVLHIE